MKQPLEIRCVTEPLDDYVEAVRRLLGQLTTRPIAFGKTELEQLLADESSRLYVACLEGTIVGMATIGTYLCPTGRKFWLEDVVVDEAYRGRGVARAFLETVVDGLHLSGTEKLYLTSNPSRVAANRLYQSMGFQSKITNVYYKTPE